jgi:hypothetical protein
MRFSTCVLRADVAVVVVRPDVITQRVFICRSRTRACWNRSEQAVTMVPLAQYGKLYTSTPFGRPPLI